MLKKKTPILLFSDEKYFTVDPSSNNRTDRSITKKNAREVPDDIRPIQKSKRPSQFMVFRIIASSGEKMPPFFLKTGLRKGA